jgi:hypothetical protein
LPLFTDLLRRKVFSETPLQPVAYVYGIAKVFGLIAEYDV